MASQVTQKFCYAAFGDRKISATLSALGQHWGSRQMTLLVDSFDPWGPISVALYDTANADFVETAVSATGLIGQWRPLSTGEAYSNSTRIRARKSEISAAYYDLPAEHRGIFVQRLLRALFDRTDGAAIRGKLEERLNAIGWALRDDLLVTQEALLAETFFPPNSQYDAYISLRDVFALAKRDLAIVDGWLGATILWTLRAIAPADLCVRFLTVARNLRPDFQVELEAFRKQMVGVRIEVRGGSDFHDRFVVVDDGRCFHIGASIKDAGSRAFMVSEIRDAGNISMLKQTLEKAWAAGRPLS